MQSGGTNAADTPAADHALPVFEGRRSHRHARHSLEELKRAAAAEAPRADRFAEVETFVQFAGFPRSGHSIVGALLSAHRECLVSHELDAMGLIELGLTREELFSLVAANARQFAENGRWWNGFCYDLPGAEAEPEAKLRVLGDKKGDWAVRRFARRADLHGELAAHLSPVRPKWISVLRNPFDNVATLSLRKGREYDRLRIKAQSEQDFRSALEREQGRTVAAETRPDMVEDYAALCAGLAALKARVPPEDWFELRHEAFVEDPQKRLSALLAFLGCDPDPEFCKAAASIVAKTAHQSRREVAWAPGHRARIEGLIAHHDFLQDYTFDD